MPPTRSLAVPVRPLRPGLVVLSALLASAAVSAVGAPAVGRADPQPAGAATPAAAPPGDRAVGARLTSTVLGGSEWDEAYDVDVDAAGNSYVAGLTTSPDLPVRAALQPSYGGGADAFVGKVDREGRLVWLTYLGGSGSDAAFGVDVDDAGRTWVAGRTSSRDFPTARPLQASIAGTGCQGEPCPDAFLAALDPSGRSLAVSTYLGGSGTDEALAVTVAADGSPALTGNTGSEDFPTSGAAQPALAGAPCPEGLPCPGDAFVTRLAPGGQRVAWSTFLGGSAAELAGGVAVTDDGGVLAVGSTRSEDFPVRRARQPRIAGRDCGPPPGTPCTDLFVTRFTGDGRPAWSTYHGGTGAESGGSVAVDPAGLVALAGSTRSRDLPVRRAAQDRLGNAGCDMAEPAVELCDDAFLALLTADGQDLRTGSYLGGAANDSGLGVAVAGDGGLVLAGSTDSRDFPGTSGPGFAGVTDVVLAAVGEDGTPVRSTLVGGLDAERADAVALDRGGVAHLAGRTGSADYPLVDPVQPGLAGDLDAVLTRLRLG